ncbi:F0F1 ATP synthase subunit A [Chloroflexota bacterium]
MPKKGCLGCSFPLIVGILAVILVLFAVGFVSGPLGKSLLGDLGLPSWLSVPRPHPELPAEVVFHLFGFPITNSIIAAWLTIIALVGFSYAVTHRLKLIPTRLQCVLEFALESLLNFCRSVAGEKNGRRFFPIITTIFLFVVFNAWLSLLPGFGSILITNAEGESVHLLRGANTDINMPLALALISFVFVEYCGLRSLGFRYLGKFINVGQFFRSIGQLFRGRFKAGFSGLFAGFIDIFVGILEALSEFIRIVSFTFRLFGNMTAGEILLLIAAFLVPWIFAIPFYGLELLVGFVQALIFGGLTLVFLTVAVAHHGEESH